MTQLTTLDELKQHITLLASVEETDSPFVSCYLNFEGGEKSWRDELDERAGILRRAHKGKALADMEEALGKIETWLASHPLPEAKGVVIFARSSFGGSFMHPLQSHWHRSPRDIDLPAMRRVRGEATGCERSTVAARGAV